MASDAVRRAAEAISENARDTVDNASREVELAEVRNVNPLQATLLNNNVNLDGEDLALSAWARTYEAEVGIKPGDAIVVKQKKSGDWLLVDVLGQQDEDLYGARLRGYSDADAFGVVEFFGHSLTSHGGGEGYMQSTASRVGATLGAEVWDYTLPGARQSFHEAFGANVGDLWFGDGGWAHMYRNIAPAPDTFGHTRRDLVVIHQGHNDLQLGTDPEDLISFTHALHAGISRALAAAIYEEDSGTVAYSGGNTRVTGGTFPVKYSSGTHLSEITGAGRTVTVTTPATFPGGRVALSFLIDPTGLAGGEWSITVDGGPASTFDVTGENAGVTSGIVGPYWTPFVWRTRELTPGAHTIVATKGGDKGYFDCWWPEAQQPPIVLVVGAAHTTSFSDSVIENSLEPAIDAALADFADIAFVRKVPMLDLIEKTTDLSDGVHFNSTGHEKASNALVNAAIDIRRTLAQSVASTVVGSGLSRRPYGPDDLGANLIRPAKGNVSGLTIQQNLKSAQTSPLLQFKTKDNVFISGAIGDGSWLSGDVSSDYYTKITNAQVLNVTAPTFGLYAYDQRKNHTDTWPTLGVDGSGGVHWGPGTAIGDVDLFRPAAGVLQLYNGTFSIRAGDLQIPSGSISMTLGDIYMANGTITVADGDLSLQDGNAVLAHGNLTLTSGSVTVASGNIGITTGNLTITSGGITLTAGNLTLSAGSVAATLAGASFFASAISGANTGIGVGVIGSSPGTGVWGLGSPAGAGVLGQSLGGANGVTGSSATGVGGGFSSSGSAAGVEAVSTSGPAYKVGSTHGSGAAFDANSKGQAINLVDPTTAQAAATKAYSDRHLAQWRTLKSFGPSYLPLDATATAYLFVGKELKAHASIPYDFPPGQMWLDSADFPAITSKTAKIRIRAWANLNGTDPATQVTLDLCPATFSGAADTLDATLGTSVATAVLTDAALGTNASVKVDGTAVAIPTAGPYILKATISAVLANNAALHLNAEVQYRYE